MTLHEKDLQKEEGLKTSIHQSHDMVHDHKEGCHTLCITQKIVNNGAFLYAFAMLHMHSSFSMYIHEHIS